MRDLQAEAFKSIAETLFPDSSGEVVVDAGTTVYVVTLEDGAAIAAEPTG